MRRSLEFSDLPLIAVELRSFFKCSEFMRLNDALSIANRAVSRGYVAAFTGQRHGLEGEVEAKLKLGQLPSIQFENETESIFAVLQDSAIYVTWLQSSEPRPYVRYSRLRDEMRWLRSEIESTLSGEFNDRVVNITYRNFIKSPDDKSRHFLSAYVRDPQLMPVADSTPNVQEVTARYRTSSGLDRAFKLQESEVAGRSSREVGWVLSTVTGLMLTESDDWLSKLEDCHADVQEFFLSVVTEEALSQWGYVNGS